MEFDRALLEILACPACKGTLEYKEADRLLLCHVCRLAYEIRDGIPVMLTDQAKPL